MVAAAASVILLLSSCGGPAAVPPKPEEGMELNWESVERSGVGDDVAFALTLTSPVMGEERVGFVDLISADGTSRFVETGPHGDRNIAAKDGRICATSETTTYELSATSARRWDRGGYPGGGVWMAANEDYSCLLVLNSGVGPSGYETDVYWGAGADQGHSVVPDVPGPTGYTDDFVWVRNAGVSSIPGTLDLYQTNLQTGRTVKYMSWPTYTEPATASTPAVNFDDGYGSDLFPFQGKLYYIEDLRAVSKNGDAQQIKPGVSAELRLGEIDVDRKKQTSSFLRYSAEGLTGTGTNGENVVPVAASRTGHLNDGRMFVVDAAGTILAIDLTKKALRETGQLSNKARRATSMAAAWHDDQLTIAFTTSQDDLVTMETYNLQTAKVVASQILTGVPELLAAGLSIESLTKVE